METLENSHSNAWCPKKEKNKKDVWEGALRITINNEEFQQQWETVKIIEKGKNNALKDTQKFQYSYVAHSGYQRQHNIYWLRNKNHNCKSSVRAAFTVGQCSLASSSRLETCPIFGCLWCWHHPTSGLFPSGGRMVARTCFLVHLQQEREAVFSIGSLLKLKKLFLRCPQGTSGISLPSLGSHHHP